MTQYSFLTGSDQDLPGVQPFKASIQEEGKRWPSTNPRFLDSGCYGAPHLLRIRGCWFIALAVASNIIGSGMFIEERKASVFYGPRARREFLPLTGRLVREMRSQSEYEKAGKQSEAALALKAERLAFIALLEQVLRHNQPISRALAEAFLSFGETSEVLETFSQES